MDQGIKKDAGKNRLDLIPVECIDAIGKVLTFGAAKYHDNSWRQGIDYSRVYSAVQRHLQAFWGEAPDIDEESKLSHLSHAFCGLAFLITYEDSKERYKTFDDRVKNSISSQPYPDLTRMTHPEACKYLKPGMRVRVLRAAEYNERDWMAVWNGEEMDSYIGNLYTIAGFTNGGSIEFVEDGQSWVFPAFVLEIVSEGE